MKQKSERRFAVYMPSKTGGSGLHIWLGRAAVHIFWPPWRRTPGPHLQFERVQRA